MTDSQLDSFLDALEAAVPQSDANRQNIANRLKASVAPVSPLPSPRSLTLQLYAALLVLAAAMSGMAGLAGFHRMSAVQWIGMGSILLAGAGLLSRSLVGQMIPGSLYRYLPGKIVWGLIGAFVMGIVFLFPWSVPEEFAARGLRCLAMGLSMSGVAATAVWLFLRRGAACRSRAMGATVGAVAGVLSVTVLQLACVHQDLGHLLVWHGLVLVGPAALGFAIAVFASEKA